ncbi:MAG: hypothetical protein WC842_00180 [Candidatus Paceibacterota bacterium]|jgi:hypothetical protein
MKNLDWNKINNDRDFQRLVNDLFALEINHPAFLSSNPEIGADGGWDGRYDGPYMGLKGVWNFQAKWTKHNLEAAYKQLQREIKKELEKAKKNKVNFLLVATNADLRIGTDDHIGKLEKLNENKKFVDQLFIWPRANLESKTTQYPLLRHNYFGDPQEPTFVPAHVFAESEPLLKGVFVGREESVNILKEFIQKNTSNLLIVHSGGGYGKTHFIVESGKNGDSLWPGIQTWFCRPGIRDINEAINELDHEKNSLIFLDDAERYLDDTRKLIAHTKTFSPGKLKVVLSCRSSGKEIVKNLADSQRVDNYNLLELPHLSEKELIEILNLAADSKKINHPERIVKELNGNLFLIITTGKLIKGGDLNPSQVKKQIKDNLDQETVNALKGVLDERNSKAFLRELSIIVPFSKEKRGNNVLDKLATVLELKVDLINEALNKLIEAKILRVVGASIRFNPDMKGDIYLSVELDKENGKDLANEMFENWLSIYPKQLTANLAAASRHKDTNSANEAVKELFQKWINETSETSDSSKSKILELAASIAFLAPEEAISLVYAYVNSSNTQNSYGLNRDTYGPVIYHVLHVPGFEKAILKLILYLAQKDLKGTYDNYKPASLIKQAISPIEVNIASATQSLKELLDWVSKGNCTELEARLASDGVLESLSGSHEHRESYGNQITFGRRILRYEGIYKKPVDEFRDVGMDVLKKLVLHSNDKIKKIGVEIVDDIGHEATSTSDDFWKRILSDKTKAIEWLEKLISETSSHEVLSSIEDVLVRYWANNNIYLDLSDKIAGILRNFPRSMEYIIFRYFVAHDLIISDFKKIESGAPESDRWSWLVHNHFRLHDFPQEELDEVVKRLSNKYKSRAEIIKYLYELENEVKGITQWQTIPLVETWSKFNNQSFIEIVDDENLLSSVPNRFHLGIYRVASDRDKQYIMKYASRILGDLNNLQRQAVDNLLDLIIRHNVSTAEFMPWISQIIEKADDYLKNLILHRSYFIFKDRDQTEKNQVVNILEQSLSGVVNSNVLDMFDFLVHNAVNWNLPSGDLDKIRKKLFEIIKDIPSVDYHTDDLLKFALNGDLDQFIELVEYRLKKQSEYFKNRGAEKFDAIPFDGFRSATELIKNYDDFAKLMDKINFWRNEELLFSFDIDGFLGKSIGGHDSEHGDYLLHYIGDKIKTGDAESLKIATNAFFGISFGADTIDLFLNFLMAAEKAGVLDEAKDVFTHQVISGSYSSTVGQAPPALVNKKEALEKISAKCQPGVIKNYVDSLTGSIADDIKRHLDEGEELISPKS